MAVLLVLLVVPILEIWAAVVVAQAIGVVPTVLALIGLSVLGVVLIRSEGLQVWRRVNAELAEGRAPGDSMLDGLMVLFGGTLLIVPGFLTAVPGLLLLFPPTRALLRPVVKRWATARAGRSATIGVGPFGPVWIGGSSFGSSYGATSGRSFSGSPGGPRDEVIDVEVVDVEVIDVEVNDPNLELPPGP